MELTKHQRNELFQLLDENGVDPADCDLDTSEGGLIVHLPTESTFRLFVEPHEYQFQWIVVDGPDSGAEVATEAWSTVLEEFKQWAEAVQYVADVPDFWEEFRQAPEALTAAQSTGASNTPFTPDEQAEISNRLDAVKQLVRKQFELTAEQLSAVDQRLDDAEEASKRLGRKDWLMAFYGAVMSTFMTDEISPHVIQTVLSTVVHGIGHIFGFGGPPPIITA